jgi:hypothetical protein
MSGPAPRPVRELAQAARTASDAQLLRMVAVLDRLPQRGAADTLLDPVRPRLRWLRPQRPLTPLRLLFLPMDGVIVAARAWRGDGRSLPRHALAPLGAAIFAAAPGLSEALQSAMTGASASDHGLVVSIGARLWPAAVEALPDGPPPGWAECGLPPPTYPRLRSLVALLWRHGSALHGLRVAGGEGPPEEMARPVFRNLAAEGGEAVEIALAAVLPFVSRPAQLAASVAGIDLALAAPAERALDQFLQALAPPEAAPDLARAAAAAQRFAQLVEDLDRSVSRDKPRRAQILQGLRNKAAATCIERLEAETQASLLAPIAAMLAGAREGIALGDAEIAALEARARALRGLAETARRLAGHHRMGVGGLAQASEQLVAALAGLPLDGAGFGRTDALRVVEILLGPDAAAPRGP